MSKCEHKTKTVEDIEPKWVTDDKGHHTISFRTDTVIWNSYSKSDVDSENELTVEQWIEFVSGYTKYIDSVDGDDIMSACAEFVEKVKTGTLCKECSDPECKGDHKK